MNRDDSLLLVLVDGLPYGSVSPRDTPFLASASARGPLEPGLGFSINIYPELFAGRQPDDLGYLNKWTIKPAEAYRHPPRLAGLAAGIADISRVWPLGSRALHKVWERAVGEKNLANIPFGMLHHFARNPSEEIFETTAYPTVFRDWDMKLLRSYLLPGRLGERDKTTVALAMEAMQSGDSLFVMLGDLDGLAHAHGLGERFDAHIQVIDGWIESLVGAFRERAGDSGHVVVLSDHGMARTDPGKAVALDLRACCGPIGRDTYVPFVDALMLRVWVRDPGLAAKLGDYLSQLECGSLLTPPERRYFGVTSPDFGDIIFLLKEGFAFYPSFFGAKYPRALHGYHPKLDSQHSYFGYWGPGDIVVPARALGVFPVLQGLAGSED